MVRRKGKNKDYSQARRKRYNENFLKRYGMPHKEWAKWKKEHTKAEVHEKRMKAMKS